MKVSNVTRGFSIAVIFLLSVTLFTPMVYAAPTSTSPASTAKFTGVYKGYADQIVKLKLPVAEEKKLLDELSRMQDADFYEGFRDHAVLELAREHAFLTEKLSNEKEPIFGDAPFAISGPTGISPYEVELQWRRAVEAIARCVSENYPFIEDYFGTTLSELKCLRADGGQLSTTFATFQTNPVILVLRKEWDERRLYDETEFVTALRTESSRLEDQGRYSMAMDVYTRIIIRYLGDDRFLQKAMLTSDPELFRFSTLEQCIRERIELKGEPVLSRLNGLVLAGLPSESDARSNPSMKARRDEVFSTFKCLHNDDMNFLRLKRALQEEPMILAALKDPQLKSPEKLADFIKKYRNYVASLRTRMAELKDRAYSESDSRTDRVLIAHQAAVALVSRHQAVFTAAKVTKQFDQYVAYPLIGCGRSTLGIFSSPKDLVVVGGVYALTYTSVPLLPVLAMVGVAAASVPSAAEELGSGEPDRQLKSICELAAQWALFEVLPKAKAKLSGTDKVERFDELRKSSEQPMEQLEAAAKKQTIGARARAALETAREKVNRFLDEIPMPRFFPEFAFAGIPASRLGPRSAINPRLALASALERISLRIAQISPDAASRITHSRLGPSSRLRNSQRGMFIIDDIIIAFFKGGWGIGRSVFLWVWESPGRRAILYGFVAGTVVQGGVNYIVPTAILKIKFFDISVRTYLTYGLAVPVGLLVTTLTYAKTRGAVGTAKNAIADVRELDKLRDFVKDQNLVIKLEDANTKASATKVDPIAKANAEKVVRTAETAVKDAEKVVRTKEKAEGEAKSAYDKALKAAKSALSAIESELDSLTSLDKKYAEAIKARLKSAREALDNGDFDGAQRNVDAISGIQTGRVPVLGIFSSPKQQGYLDSLVRDINARIKPKDKINEAKTKETEFSVAKKEVETAKEGVETAKEGVETAKDAVPEVDLTQSAEATKAVSEVKSILERAKVDLGGRFIPDALKKELDAHLDAAIKALDGDHPNPSIAAANLENYLGAIKKAGGAVEIGLKGWDWTKVKSRKAAEQIGKLLFHPVTSLQNTWGVISAKGTPAMKSAVSTIRKNGKKILLIVLGLGALLYGGWILGMKVSDYNKYQRSRQMIEESIPEPERDQIDEENRKALKKLEEETRQKPELQPAPVIIAPEVESQTDLLKGDDTPTAPVAPGSPIPAPSTTGTPGGESAVPAPSGSGTPGDIAPRVGSPE